LQCSGGSRLTIEQTNAAEEEQHPTILHTSV
jgi:hypothetical protein